MIMLELIHADAASLSSTSIASGGAALAAAAAGGVVPGLLLNALTAVWHVKHAWALSSQVCAHWGVVWPGVNFW